MKVRTFLLFACMIVVPGLAMFSHRVPAEVRSATRCALWDPIQTWAERWSTSDSGETLGDGNAAAVDAEVTAGQPQERLAGMVPLAADDPRSGFGGRSPEGAAGRLAALGVSAVECRPFDPQTGRHVASCRVPIDASAQLHRVFQADGGSPQEAVSSLADQVEAWRDRLAARAEDSGNPARPAGF